jgi:hypothetical protein
MREEGLAPFTYPTEPHCRKRGPNGYTDYTSYKDWLRDEFCFRCVYCLEREMWDRSRADAYSVEHIKPQATNPKFICEYDFLVYACCRCNSRRRDVMILDPNTVALADHISVNSDGTITGLTVEGKEMVDILKLNISPALDIRKWTIRLLDLKRRLPGDETVDLLIQNYFGFPEALPDLDAKNPPSNTRPEGLRDSYFRKRREGRLPTVY